MTLETTLQQAAEEVEQELDRLLPDREEPQARLLAAMRHAALGGGKRIRPFLAMACGDLFAVPRCSTRRAGAALEMVHCYSLIHDDLPCMDDDDMRRGKPTVHRAFDEATAVLAGDALLTFAFDVLTHPTIDTDPAIQLELVQKLARAAGHNGMCAGQIIDLQAEQRTPSLNQIIHLQRLKTGALLSFACEAGAILGRATADERQSLTTYGANIGLAFQITDDILDIEGNPDTVGKAVGKDSDAGKATLVGLLGLDQARDRALVATEQAVAAAANFGAAGNTLRALAEFVIARDR